ncbi:MAG: divalent metal cation transporter [Nitrososphaeria archaeon]|nr:divalent metal cation transporter [Nitrososphaerota archaeon]NDB92382.1 divalent metal cation transporter [Nitrososphaeria archaeon]NDF47293.1 divalent metal cation transporter [Nitrosopumilaceae archaeon]
MGKLRDFFRNLGPGIITGASDDDPSGIATYSQAGAQFGFGTLWFAPFQYPLMSVIQEMCARIGLVTGGGLGNAIKKQFSRRLVFPITGLLLIANTINIGVDIGAMAAATKLVFPQVPVFLAAICFIGFIVGAEVFLSYKKYARFLKFLTFSLLAYVVTAVIVGGNLGQILTATVIPHFELNAQFAMIFVALFGTTISPYLFFWQASEEAEEDVAKRKISEIDVGDPKITKKEIKSMRIDVATGMAFSQIIMWFIILTSAGTLYQHGITNIATADDAAKALEPLVKSFPYSGQISKIIFALGIIGTGLLAIPVLAGSSAYALADGFGWRQGLSKKFRQAKAFYLSIIVSTAIGLAFNFVQISPITALIYAAVINGVTAVPMLFVIMKIANNKKILYDKTNNKTSNVLGWITFCLMALSVCVMFGFFILGKA